MEWVLILTLHIMGPQGSIRDVQFQMIDGFLSESSCQAAGNKLARSLIEQVGKHAKQQNITKTRNNNVPSVFIDCTSITK